MRALKTIAFLSITLTSQCFSNIEGSKHDLSYEGYASNTAVAGGSSFACVFCHTPTGSSSSFKAEPLWDKNGTSNSYELYESSLTQNSSTFKSNIEEINSNSSKACLSCHDGVSAVNATITTPDSGANYVGVTGTINDESSNITSTNGSSSTSGSITFDHPISIKYRGDGSLTSPASLRDINGKFGGEGTWVTPDGSQDIMAVLRGPENNMLECASCHDPHLGDASTFLRTSNSGSKLCLGCHNK